MVQVTFVSHDGSRREIDATAGLSLMEVAKAQDVPGIEAVCGGNAYCGTCRVEVAQQWLDLLNPIEDFEQDLIDAVGRLDHVDAMSETRLSCQIVAADRLSGLVVHTPAAQS